MIENQLTVDRYLAGNFAPIQTTLPLTPCSYEGLIPSDLAGGQYVRNGGNPLTNEDLARDAHWFDGDGMLSGVLFRRISSDGQIRPEFVNQYLLTDVYCYAKSATWLRHPVIPSISTLVNPLSSLLHILSSVCRAVTLVVTSRLPGRWAIHRISVANTNVVYHDGRALATCESGPPLRFSLPSLETIGWWNGRSAGNEKVQDTRTGFGGNGPLSFMREWTTAHPRVDPETGEFIAFHSAFAAPYVRYSIVNSSKKGDTEAAAFFDQPVPGVAAPTLMHDFGVSKNHTIIMDLPLSLDPMNKIRGAPSLFYDSSKNARFGVFPRHAPNRVRWFDTSPCLIFHTTNCWDVFLPKKDSGETWVNLLVCRMTTASVVYGSANLPVPVPASLPSELVEEEQCRLYYYSFVLPDSTHVQPSIRHQWALSAIPFEFSLVAPANDMKAAKYAYGCSTSESFGSALGKASKIDYLVKLDVKRLIARGEANPPETIRGCVDMRTVDEIMASKDPEDPIKLFKLPPGCFAQEPRFVPRQDGKSEDDGYLITYVFNEAQLDAMGTCPPGSKSELWILDARDMKTVAARIQLPQRVPYGLHGKWFSEEELTSQRAHEDVRKLEVQSTSRTPLTMMRDMLERWLT